MFQNSISVTVMVPLVLLDCSTCCLIWFIDLLLCMFSLFSLLIVSCNNWLLVFQKMRSLTSLFSSLSFPWILPVASIPFSVMFSGVLLFIFLPSFHHHTFTSFSLPSSSCPVTDHLLFSFPPYFHLLDPFPWISLSLIVFSITFFSPFLSCPSPFCLLPSLPFSLLLLCAGKQDAAEQIPA